MLSSRRISAICALGIMLVAGGCGGSTETVFRNLPANVIVFPRGTAGVLGGSSTHTALRALGVPSQVLPLDSIQQIDLSAYPVLILEEGILGDERALAAYPFILERVKRGTTLLMMKQSPETMQTLRARFTDLIAPRSVEYTLEAMVPRSDDPIMQVLDDPNRITQTDLDSLSRYAMQMVAGGRRARAVLASNIVEPNAAALLLWEPIGRGQLFYSALALTPRAAAGHAAEQKLLANLLSYTQPQSQ
jgi:hypothetical protein